MEIQHFSHEHPLILRVEKKNNGEEENCSACELPIASGHPSYGCRQCKEFVIHNSCAELPQTIQHPFHKLHSLTLFDKSLKLWNSYSCSACTKFCSGFVFHCSDCDFDLCVPCSSLVPTISYPGHEHLLNSFLIYYSRLLRCNCCLENFESHDTLRCVDCNFNLHKSCFDLSPQIQHPFHPLHTLTLLTRENPAHCTACYKLCNGFFFRCEECDFNLDIKCSSLRPSIEYEAHDHLLNFFEKIYGYNSLCNSCNTRCDNLVLRCVKCDFNVHKLCTEWPKQIQHPFHLHPLTLGDHDKFNYRCAACTAYNFSEVLFRCEECDFNIDTGCASLVPTIAYESHDHLLTLIKINIEKEKDCPPCNYCHTPCNAYTFRCVKCDFSSHIHCIPSLLPRIIKHKCHIDPLVLTDSVIEEGYDFDDFYCDACETKRNPSNPVYYCEECQFVAHINCVMSKVLPLLISEQETNMRAKKSEIIPASAILDAEIQRCQMDIEARTTKLEKRRKKVEVQRKELEAQRKKLEVLEENFEAQEEKLETLKAKIEALESESSQYIASTSRVTALG